MTTQQQTVTGNNRINIYMSIVSIEKHKLISKVCRKARVDIQLIDFKDTEHFLLFKQIVHICSTHLLSSISNHNHCSTSILQPCF